MNLSSGAIGESVAFHRERYGGEGEVSIYLPDIYPNSYIFKSGGMEITLTPMPKVVKKIDIFFELLPSDSVEALLERYSGCTGWKQRSLLDKVFEATFPMYNTTDERNSFYAAEKAMALIQRDVGFGKLVLWIQSPDYQTLLASYRRKKKVRAFAERVTSIWRGRGEGGA